MASPGPALLLAVRNTLTGGWAAGALTGCGLGLVAAGWTLTALLGLDAIFALVPWAYGALKIAGAGVNVSEFALLDKLLTRRGLVGIVGAVFTVAVAGGYVIQML